MRPWTVENLFRWIAGGNPVGDDDYVRTTGIPERFLVRRGLRLERSSPSRQRAASGAARQLGRERAAEWKARLGDELEEPSTDPLRNELDPRRLARDIPRW